MNQKDVYLTAFSILSLTLTHLTHEFQWVLQRRAIFPFCHGVYRIPFPLENLSGKFASLPVLWKSAKTFKLKILFVCAKIVLAAPREVEFIAALPF